MHEGVESEFHVELRAYSIAATFDLIVSGLERIHSLVGLASKMCVC